jgi:hypothetical protein
MLDPPAPGVLLEPAAPPLPPLSPPLAPALAPPRLVPPPDK